MSMSLDAIYSRNSADTHYLWDALCEGLKSLKNRVANAWSKCTCCFASNAEFTTRTISAQNATEILERAIEREHSGKPIDVLSTMSSSTDLDVRNASVDDHYKLLAQE